MVARDFRLAIRGPNYFAVKNSILHIRPSVGRPRQREGVNYDVSLVRILGPGTLGGPASRAVAPGGITEPLGSSR